MNMTNEPIEWKSVSYEDTDLPYIDSEMIITVEDRFNDLHEVRIEDLVQRLSAVLSDRELAGLIVRLEQELQSLEVFEFLTKYVVGEIKKMTYNQFEIGMDFSPVIKELLKEL
jgi:hypothetical protein